ncbi:hypothetical protein PBC1_009 [Bacillus phage PBC1]|uniref:Uncharacterized protein n=1 Tax=Bacillus phage PBC1 TaxID=1161901 RepID=I1TLE3_9CAUD|nr:hypothetical protein PBC1_gp09 [Bacillus phage PBC1]AFE86245.1 hypothetical protein PBC1_009 [Bacillus phage PBC1]
MDNMAKFKALQNFVSEELGLIEEGEVKEITVTKADEINAHTLEYYRSLVLERVEEPKKAGKK